MLKSPAVLVVMATDFCCGWGNACIISMTPTFMKVGFDIKVDDNGDVDDDVDDVAQDVLGFDITSNGVMSMLPHLARTIVGNVSCITILVITKIIVTIEAADPNCWKCTPGSAPSHIMSLTMLIMDNNPIIIITLL